MGYIERYYLDNLNGLENQSLDDFGNPKSDDPVFIREEDTGGGGGVTPNKDLTPDGDKDISNTLGNNLNLADEYTFQITTEFLEGRNTPATVYVNGIPLPNQAPNEYKVRLKTLFKEGPQTIEIKKTGYISNQKYILEVIGTGETNINDITLLEDPVSQATLGINKLELNVKYFEDNQEKPYNRRFSGTLVSLPFILAIDPTPVLDENLSELKINLIGPNSSVQIFSSDESELLDSGETEYSDTTGTKYFIKSPNPTLYRISEIVITDNNGNSETLSAGKSETVSLELVLNRDLQVSILSHRVVKVKVLKPIIKLEYATSKKYNINDKTDIPITITKNKDVRAISMIIGNEILEFDNLPGSVITGVKIPHRLIDKIGTYNIKLFPYSISELQKGQKETDVKELPPPPPPKTNPNIIKETPVIRDTQQETDTTLPPIDKGNYTTNPSTTTTLTPVTVSGISTGGSDFNNDRLGGRS